MDVLAENDEANVMHSRYEESHWLAPCQQSRVGCLLFAANTKRHLELHIFIYLDCNTYSISLDE